MKSSSSSTRVTRSCESCLKTYTRKSDFQRHKILCEIVNRSEREAKIASETGDLPNYNQLFAIVNELAYKCAKMEDKIASVQKWTTKQKKKINIIDWLNANVTQPECLYQEFKETIRAECGQESVQYLFKNNLLQTIQHVFEQNYALKSSAGPIYCFEQKPNTFYICDAANPLVWTQMTKETLINLLNSMYTKLLSELLVWRKCNVDPSENDSDDSNSGVQSRTSDRVDVLFNQTIIKLTKEDFNKDHTLSAIKSALFNYLKKDLKNMIEYEFE